MEKTFLTCMRNGAQDYPTYIQLVCCYDPKQQYFHQERGLPTTNAEGYKDQPFALHDPA